MNQLIYNLLFVLSIVLCLSTNAQGNADNCNKECLVKKEVHDGSFLGLELARACGEKGGVVIRVIHNSPADLAGLKPGDHIVRVNSFTPDNFMQVVETVKACDPFETNTISYHRDGVTYTTEVKLRPINHRMVETTICCDSEDGLGIDFDLYPNPSKDHSFVRVNHSQEDINNVSLYSLNGQLLNSQTIDLSERNVLKLDARELSNGLYYIRISNTSGYLTKRLIVAN